VGLYGRICRHLTCLRVIVASLTNMTSIEDSTTEPGVAEFAFFDRKVETRVKTTSQTPAAAEDEHSP
jgi:hypothetical protein